MSVAWIMSCNLAFSDQFLNLKRSYFDTTCAPDWLNSRYNASASAI